MYCYISINYETSSLLGAHRNGLCIFLVQDRQPLMHVAHNNMKLLKSSEFVVRRSVEVN